MLIQRISTIQTDQYRPFWRETEIASKKIDARCKAKATEKVEIPMVVPHNLKKFFVKPKTPA